MKIIHALMLTIFLGSANRALSATENPLEGLDVKTVDLFTACGQGNLEKVEKTIAVAFATLSYDRTRLKTFVNQRDALGRTPLHYAAGELLKDKTADTHNYPAIVTKLSLAGADLHALDNEGKDPETYLTENEKGKEITEQSILHMSLLFELDKTEEEREVEAVREVQEASSNCVIL